MTEEQAVETGEIPLCIHTVAIRIRNKNSHEKFEEIIHVDFRSEIVHACAPAVDHHLHQSMITSYTLIEDIGKSSTILLRQSVRGEPLPRCNINSLHSLTRFA